MSDHGAFERRADAIVDSWLARHPTEATSLGDHRFDHELDDPGADAARQRATEVRGHLTALEGIEVTGRDEAVDRELLRTALRSELLELEELDEASWNPMVHNPGQALHHLSFAFAPAEQRLESALARLAATPRYLAAARERLGKLSGIHTSTAVGQFDGTIALVADLLPRLAAEAGRPAPDTTAALLALQAHRDWLAERRAGSEADRRLGSERFTAKLALTLDTDFAPADLLARAEADLERLGDEIVAAAGRFADVADPDKTTVRAVLDELADEAPTSETILGLCRDALAETTAFVRSADLITVYDDPIDVVEMPEKASRARTAGRPGRWSLRPCRPSSRSRPRRRSGPTSRCARSSARTTCTCCTT